MPVKLYAPDSYWKIPEKERNVRHTACGAGKGLGDFLIPDSLWGLNVTEACRIHDYMYSVGKTEEDREMADKAFLNNLVRLIEGRYKEGKWKPVEAVLATLRRYRAMSYYNAVRNFGGPAFWDSKNSEAEMEYVSL